MSEQLIDRIAGTGLAIALGAVVIVWFAVWLPARDEFLSSTHDCFLSHHCDDYPTYEAHEQCWDACATKVREAKRASK